MKINCVFCVRRSKKSVSANDGQLTGGTSLQWFSYLLQIGKGMFWPIFVQVKRPSDKLWGFLFTCLTAHALHIELLPSMEMNSCVVGIEMFIARRGKPSFSGQTMVPTSLLLRRNFLCLYRVRDNNFLRVKSLKGEFCGALIHLPPPSW